jgi:type I restriction enzyme S subunit
MSEWKETTLGEICLKITDGAHHSPKEFDGGKPMFSVKNMRDQGFDYNGVKTISDEDFVKLVNSGCQPQKDDILIAKDGSVMKHIFRVKGDIDYVLLSSIAIVRPDKSKVNPSYLVYAIKDPSTTDLILNNFVGGSGVPRIVLKDFKKVDLTIPSIETQKSIASILSSLDDKIDLLHRQNATLEKMAETLFRQWFIEEAKEREKTKIGLVLETVLGGTPSTKKPEYWDGTIPWINSGEVNNFRILKPTKFITELGLAESNTKLLPIGTTVLAITGATLGQISLLEISTCANQSVVGIIPNETYPKEYVFLWIKYMIDEIILNETGGAQPHINKNDVNETEILVPCNDDLEFIESKIKPLFKKISINSFQINTLIELRDSLLPKLMSGEITVNQG